MFTSGLVTKGQLWDVVSLYTPISSSLPGHKEGRRWGEAGGVSCVQYYDPQWFPGTEGRKTGEAGGVAVGVRWPLSVVQIVYHEGTRIDPVALVLL